MAGDLQMTISGAQKTKCASKIFKVIPNRDYFPEPFIVGFSGDASEIMDVVDFYEHPEIYQKAPKVKGLHALVLTEGGKIFQFQDPNKWVLMDTKFATVGSGGSVALGAMHVGASPKQAVEAASKVDPFTGMGVKVFKFN